MQKRAGSTAWTVAFIALMLVAGAGALVGRNSFEAVFSDAATRLAFQIRDEAVALKRSGQTVRTFEHRPWGWPLGVTADYRVELTEGWKPPRPGHRSIGVARNLTEPTFYATSYHLNYVDVPNDLKASHRKGEATLVTLVLRDGKVLLTDLK